MKSETFELQARTERAWNNQRQPSDTGTVLGAFAGRALYLEEETNVSVSTARVHVEMSPDRTSGTVI